MEYFQCKKKIFDKIRKTGAFKFINELYEECFIKNLEKPNTVISKKKNKELRKSMVPNIFRNTKEEKNEINNKDNKEMNNKENKVNKDNKDNIEINNKENKDNKEINNKDNNPNLELKITHSDDVQEIKNIIEQENLVGQEDINEINSNFSLCKTNDKEIEKLQESDKVNNNLDSNTLEENYLDDIAKINFFKTNSNKFDLDKEEVKN